MAAAAAVAVLLAAAVAPLLLLMIRMMVLVLVAKPSRSDDATAVQGDTGGMVAVDSQQTARTTIRMRIFRCKQKYTSQVRRDRSNSCNILDLAGVALLPSTSTMSPFPPSLD